MSELEIPDDVRYAFICDAGAPGLPQHLVVKDTPAEVVAAALAVYDSYAEDEGLTGEFAGMIPESEEWSFWASYGDSPTHFEKLGWVSDRQEIVEFFETHE